VHDRQDNRVGSVQLKAKHTKETAAFSIRKETYIVCKIQSVSVKHPVLVRIRKSVCPYL